MSEEANQGKKDQFEIKIEVSKEVVDGSYSNLVIINHSPSEFVLDFTTLLPGATTAQVKSRIIMTPTHAKSLLLAMQDNIGKYEKLFGVIPSPRTGNSSGFMGNSLHYN